MYIFSHDNTIRQRTVRYWGILAVVLVLVFMIKEMIVTVNLQYEEIYTPATGYVGKNSIYRIYINLNNQKMYVYKNEEIYETYNVSGGKSSSPSPTGEWIITHKAAWGDNFGGAWLGLNVPWGKYGIHGTRHTWAIGRQNISGGCIRMNNEDVNELYKFIPCGTKVTIVFENQPFRNLKDGDFGSDVYKVQIALKNLGYFHNWCDGKFGKGTKEAVMKYQKASKLAETGIVNISTWDKLMHDYEDNSLE